MLQFHIFFIVIGLSCLGLSFVAAVMFLVQNANIKQKRFGALTRALPSVESIDKWMLRFLLVGFTAMTIGLVMGVILAHKGWSEIWTSEPDIVFAMVCWFWYGVMLVFRSIFGWRGRRLSYLNIVGFVALLFTLFGLESFFGEGVHTFF